MRYEAPLELFRREMGDAKGRSRKTHRDMRWHTGDREREREGGRKREREVGMKREREREGEGQREKRVERERGDEGDTDHSVERWNEECCIYRRD